jgi:hypothetical protein
MQIFPFPVQCKYHATWRLSVRNSIRITNCETGGKASTEPGTRFFGDKFYRTERVAFCGIFIFILLVLNLHASS